MKLTNLTRAVAEAKRFIDRAEAAAAVLQSNQPRALGSLPAGKASAALRRSSLDLTASLAALRRR